MVSEALCIKCFYRMWDNANEFCTMGNSQYFFILVFGLFWALKKHEWQNMLLVVCSAVFYGWVHPWFLLLLYGSAVLDFNMGKRMVSTPSKKKTYLWISMLGNVGMLGYFKYCNFFIDNSMPYLVRWVWVPVCPT